MTAYLKNPFVRGLLLGAAVVLAGIGVWCLLTGPNASGKPWGPGNPWFGGVPPQACTQDAMICPDGTGVGRTGPNCEFVCPDAE